MARLRLGAALLLPAPLCDEIDGLRRALGDTGLGRVPPHLTLVPPVNVRTEAVGTALSTLRRAAAATPRRFDLTLGPVATFSPASPVIYLAVGGDTEALHRLRDRVFTAPLERPLTWPFVPHVTLADQAEQDRIGAALLALGGFQGAFSAEAVHLLQEQGHGSERRWVPIAGADFGPPAVIGRGGLALEVVRGDTFDPEAEALVAAGCDERAPAAGDGAIAAGRDGEYRPGAGRRPILLSARREGEVVGVAAAWVTDDGARVAVLTAPSHRRQGIGGHLLAALESAVHEAGWTSRKLDALGPAGFYAARSRWSVARDYSKTIDE